MIPSITLEYAASGTICDRMDALREAGFPAVNLATNVCEFLLAEEKGQIAALRKELQCRQLKVDWIHFPYIHLVLYNHQHPYYHYAMGALKKTIEIGADLEAVSVVVHPFNKQFPSEQITGKACVEQLRESFSVLVAYAKSCGVALALENIDEPYSSTIVPELLDSIEGLSLCFDTGHAEKWKTWDTYLPKFLHRIKALHIHDNHGVRDEHLIPGDGIVDFARFFRMLEEGGYTGYLGLECTQRISNYPGSYDELAWKIRDRMQDFMLGEKEAVI